MVVSECFLLCFRQKRRTRSPSHSQEHHATFPIFVLLKVYLARLRLCARRDSIYWVCCFFGLLNKI